MSGVGRGSLGTGGSEAKGLVIPALPDVEDPRDETEGCRGHQCVSHSVMSSSLQPHGL